MASLALGAYPHPELTPPSMQLYVVATGTPTVTSVTITRQDPDGTKTVVRTADGGPLPLSGGSAIVYDPEVPYGADVSYVASGAGAGPVIASGRLDVDRPWLVHVGIPSRSVPVEFRVGTNDDESLEVDQGVFPVLGRSTPIVVTGGARQAPASTLIVGTETPAQAHAMRQILADASPLLLNVPPTMGLGLERAYIAVGSASVRRPSSIGTDPHRDFVLPYRVVSRPSGGAQGLVTWQSLYDTYGQPTWDELYAATGQPMWIQLGMPSS